LSRGEAAVGLDLLLSAINNLMTDVTLAALINVPRALEVTIVLL
jgi:hypothetical protein